MNDVQNNVQHDVLASLHQYWLQCLTTQQLQATEAQQHLLIRAGAGSGKTHVLSQRVLFLLALGYAPRQICAVTFSEAAAAELKSRIEQQIQQHIRSHPEHRAFWLQQLQQWPEAQISTIHSLCGRIAREHPRESGGAFDTQILDANQAEHWLNQHLPSLLAAIAPQHFEAVPYSVFAEVLPALLNDPLNSHLALQAYPQEANALQDVWLNRLQQLAQAAWQQLQQQLQLAVDQLLQHPSAPNPWPNDLFGTKVQALQHLLQHTSCPTATDLHTWANFELRGGSKKVWDTQLEAVKALLKDAREQISGLPSAQLNVGDQQWLASWPAFVAGYQEAWQKYQQLRQEARVMSFGDLEFQAYQALQHPQVQQYYHRRWSVVFIDEFQDTTPSQWAILRTLMHPHSLFTLVGDEKQSIYGFRGADVSLIRELSQATSADTEPAYAEQAHTWQIVDLQQSFRSHQGLVELSNRVFQQRFSPSQHPFAVDMRPLQANRTQKPHESASAEIHLIESQEDAQALHAAEARLLAQRLLHLQQTQHLVHSSDGSRPLRWSDVAVLFRSSTHILHTVQALQQAQIPFQLSRGGPSLFHRPEIIDLCQVLHFLSQPNNDLALLSILRSPAILLSEDDLYIHRQSQLKSHASLWKYFQNNIFAEQYISVLQNLLDARANLSAAQLLYKFTQQTDYLVCSALLPDGQSRLDNIEYFLGYLQDVQYQGQHSLYQLSQILENLAQSKDPSPEYLEQGLDAIQLMTIHKSKGLEFPVIYYLNSFTTSSYQGNSYFIDAQLGISYYHEFLTEKPNIYTYFEQEYKTRHHLEELRLQYVAYTRASDLLILSNSYKPNTKNNITDQLPDFDNTDIAIYQHQAQYIPAIKRQASPSLTLQPSNFYQASFSYLLPESLAVSSLHTYAQCPKKFFWSYLQYLPGNYESYSKEAGFISAKSLGQLFHTAICKQEDPTDFKKWFKGLSVTAQTQLQPLLDHMQSPLLSELNGVPFQREHSIEFTLAGQKFQGIIDASTSDWLIDYKTDSQIEPERHLLQLALYQYHLKTPKTSLVYVKHQHIHTFSPTELAQGLEKAEQLIFAMQQGHFEATPQASVCLGCMHNKYCSSALIQP